MNFKLKVFLILVLGQSLMVFSQGAFIATLYFIDGTERSGFANLITSDCKHVVFRETQSGKSEKIPSSGLRTITYSNEKEKHEYDRIYVYAGISQKRVKGPYWLKVVKRGFASLYTVDVHMAGGQYSHGAKFTDFYIMREGERAAKLISTVAAMNSNSVFRSNAPKYFSDYPELAEKIRDREYKYNDLEIVVDLYNEWIRNKNNNQ
jgi:hypothetical protein